MTHYFDNRFMAPQIKSIIAGAYLLLVSLFIVTVLDLFTFKTSSPLPIEDTQYLIVKKRYPWVTKELYTSIKKEMQNFPLDNGHFLIFALIQAESEGKPYAVGPRVRHYSHRARGLMQVMPFWVNKNEVEKLFDPIFNTRTGIKILKKYRAPRIAQTLKNYNSGPSSRYYNWKYIRKIVKNYNQMQVEWLIQRPT